MMARRGVLGLLAVSAIAALSGCGLIGGTKSYRFRMTIEIETPQGLKSGSAVMEITAYKKMKLTSEEHSGGGSFRGEAVVVDLPSGPIFVLLKNDGSGQTLDVQVTSALAPDAKFMSVDDYVATVGKLGGMFGGAKAELPHDNWPMMVRFRDINDPKSVVKVDPEAVGVKRIWLETTSDLVTTGIDRKLRWLRGLNGNYLNGATTARNAGLGLASGNFSSEIFTD